MSEYRQDATSGDWVIVAPERSRCRSDQRPPEASHGPDAGHDRSCPFCPGNERLLPPIVEQTPADGLPGWSTRVVPNKHPALQPMGDPHPVPLDQQLRLAGFGYHEVIIESPRHDADLATYSDAELTAVVRAWHARFAELSDRPGIEAAFVFRNHGPGAGASLRHPHSQAVATAIIPPWLAVKTGWARGRFAETGRCATCDEVAHEVTDGRRVVEATRRFLVAVPFAARSPCELRITPIRHQASFADAGTAEIIGLGPVLRRAVLRLQAAYGDLAYNLVIGSAAPHGCDAASDHWSLSIVPDLVRPGGFELGSGLPINPARPEDDAAMLRSSRAATPLHDFEPP